MVTFLIYGYLGIGASIAFTAYANGVMRESGESPGGKMLQQLFPALDMYWFLFIAIIPFWLPVVSFILFAKILSAFSEKA